MTKRREFPRAVKVAVVKRATRESVVYCEQCGLPAKKWQVDHRIPDSHGGEPVLENAQLLGECCYSIKNPQDTTAAAKIKRQQAAHLRIKTAPAKPIQSPGFTPAPKRSASGAAVKITKTPVARQGGIYAQYFGDGE